MTANLVVASQGFAEQIAKQAVALQTKQEGNVNQHLNHRKADLGNIFGSKAEEHKEMLFAPKVLEPVAVSPVASIFIDPVAQSQFEAAQVAKKADLMNYDAATVGAKFGGIA